MVKQRRSTGRGFLLGLIIGLVAGVVLALIFTPSPGEGDYADVVRKRYGDAIEQGKDAYARARDEVLSRYNRAKAGDYSAQ